MAEKNDVEVVEKPEMDVSVVDKKPGVFKRVKNFVSNNKVGIAIGAGLTAAGVIAAKVVKETIFNKAGDADFESMDDDLDFDDVDSILDDDI